MHIPDGVLSPATSTLAAAAMLPVWAIAARRVRASLGARQIPMLALGAAFCFTVMMFNIPAPGGTTAHPVAGTLLAILLGPYAACIGISVALAIQALFFGDGGLLAYGANCFTMAFALPFVGYSVYRLIAKTRLNRPAIRPLAGAMGAYIGLNAAAALVAVLLGIQPALFHEPNGHALYFPFGLRVTLPAMLITHLFVAGPAEAVVTGLVARYLQTAGYEFYQEEGGREKGEGERAVETAASPVVQRRKAKGKARSENLAIGLLAIVALTPLGLIAKGDAFAEWDAASVRERIEKTGSAGYVPQGVAQAEEHGYKGVRGLQDYASNEGKNKIGYVGAGLLGAATIASLLLLGGRLLTGKPVKSAQANEEQTEAEQPERGEDDPRGGTGGGGGFGQPRSQEGDTQAAQGDLPGWLRKPADPAPFSDTTGRKSNPFLERTLGELAHGALVTLQSEQWTRQPGYLQRLDPRAKVGAFLGLIAVVTSLHQAGTLLCLYAFALLLAAMSRLPLPLMLKRVWLSVPLFVGALALPATLNLVTPGRPLVTIWTHPLIFITLPGLALAAALTLRAGVAVTFAALLTLSTPWNDLLRALRVLFVPRLFVSVLAMTYRYLAVLMQSADDLFVARRSRTVGQADAAQGRRFVGASMGALFGRSAALSEEVYGAMVSRGFNGDIHTLRRLRWRLADSLWMGAALVAALLCAGAEHGW